MYTNSNRYWQQSILRGHQHVVALLLACLLFSSLSIAQEADLDSRFQALHRTPNWRFITPEFIDRITQRQAKLEGTKITVDGTLRDSDGESIADAFILLRLVTNNSLFSYTRPPEDVFAVGWSDSDGIFRFHQQPTPWFEPAYQIDWQLLVFAPGKALEIRDFLYFDTKPRTVEIDLSPEQVIRGKTVDAEGVAVEGVTVAQYEIVEPYKGEILCSFLWSECLCSVESDSDGNFAIGGLPADRTVSVSPLAFARGGVNPFALLGYQNTIVATSELDEASLYSRKRAGVWRLIHPHASQQFEMRSDKTIADIHRMKADLEKRIGARDPQRAAPTRLVRVRVVDSATGEGVSEVGIGVSSLTSKPDSLSSHPGMEISDEDGNALIEIPRRNGRLIYAIGRKFGYVTHYRRMTTWTEEYTPEIEQDEWIREVPAGDENVDLTFKVTPVPPLKLTVTKEDGTPVVAKVEVWRHGGSKQYNAVNEYTDANGVLELPLRPVIFSIDITATTDDGLVGQLNGVELSKTLTEEESAVIVVKHGAGNN